MIYLLAKVLSDPFLVVFVKGGTGWSLLIDGPTITFHDGR